MYWYKQQRAPRQAHGARSAAGDFATRQQTARNAGEARGRHADPERAPGALERGVFTKLGPRPRVRPAAEQELKIRISGQRSIARRRDPRARGPRDTSSAPARPARPSGSERDSLPQRRERRQGSDVRGRRPVGADKTDRGDATAGTRDQTHDERRLQTPRPQTRLGIATLRAGNRGAGLPDRTPLLPPARAVLGPRSRLPPQRPLVPQTRGRVRDALLSRRPTQRTTTDGEASSLRGPRSSARRALPRRAPGDTSGFGNRAARPATARAAASPRALLRAAGQAGTGRAPPALRPDRTPRAAGCAARRGSARASRSPALQQRTPPPRHTAEGSGAAGRAGRPVEAGAAAARAEERPPPPAACAPAQRLPRPRPGARCTVASARVPRAETLTRLLPESPRERSGAAGGPGARHGDPSRPCRTPGARR
ncbi:translation initiation factor IF-2-like [Meles meles]|uniref:translation initiation factor IF-2-like n=1 Tax=Meles meles TaxID=9662 RepID=UPI001E69DC3E|nr:translation initiation factor IF-2-like [Meles meles]